MTTYTVTIPTDVKLLNSNSRLHRRKQAQLTKGIREAAGWVAKAAKIPTLDRVEITAEIQPGSKQRRDPHNWQPSVKAAIDGIVDAGVLIDDDANHLLKVSFVLGEPHKPTRLVLRIHDLSGAVVHGH
ncbi:hypothetical protein [Allonocardiopsis opalescens]|uniref:Holliday junction resolvase RusA-like endonuclease n=1 Tax=Allonocardiopsis opalescens TaxID=1144618 RepID=A0A2T0PP48_9ACTN|nr:hypothetical protein [Allonocardiopsis opalescens]PRX90680.1 hypothetical protein CLV72_11818 [Allonocardiopsis opalescens]